jgi:DNA gyrase subunit A
MDPSSQRIIPVNIEDQMKTAYIDYSMSVIVARALPDVRDGFKPVHRRVLFGMHELGMAYNKPHKKSARIVGEVLGKYHPHGDSSVYDTMVRMAQNWSLRYPLIDGQGNFGSMDGDSPAAMRYTEARLARISEEMLADIEKDTVDFINNFDDSLQEPSVLPARLPNLLVNGASGIAVGMATNMLPHNLSEVIDGVVAMVDKPDITVEELTQFIKGPDFPTGGIIYGYDGVKEAFETGRGRVVVRGRANIETSHTGKESIIITEIPYQVNKASLIIKIADLVNEKKIEGISDIRDESSDRSGLRIVVEIKRDAMASVVLSKLYKYTPLQNSYGVNNVALVRGRPYTLNLRELIDEFILFRLEVIVRRTRFELRKALERAHVLLGLLIALDYIDRVIDLIRASRTPEEAREGLMKGAFIDDLDAFWAKFGQLIQESPEELRPAEGFVLSETQARAILDMRLQRLTGLERDKVRAEFDELLHEIKHLRDILDSEHLQREIVKKELTEIKEKFGDPRRTEITFADGEISMEELIPDDDVVVTISHLGYIKRTPVSEYKLQGRGGRGTRGAKTRETDFVEHMFVGNNHAYLLLFTEQGKCHWLRVFEIPEASKTSSGRVIQNILAIPQNDKVKAYIIIPDLTDVAFTESHFIVFCTKAGMIKKTSLEAFTRPRSGGIAAISINEGDQLLEARLTNGGHEIFIATRQGNAIRFNERTVRPMGRTAAGVKGVTLTGAKDAVVGMVCIDPNDESYTILVVSEKGNGKRSQFQDYRLTNRGAKGVRTMMVTDKTGAVIAIKAVREEEDLMITTKLGIVIRMPVNDIRVMGRATQGVRVIRLDEDDEIADVAILQDGGEEEETNEE